MKYIFGLFLLFSVLGNGFNKASRINNTAQEAKAYYEQGHYPKAISLYYYLADSLGVTDEQLQVNLAHALFLNGDVTKAQKKYAQLAKSNYPKTQSVALTQLGLIYFEKDNPERALYHFKKALILNPGNEVARYNYELVKKYLALSAPPTPRQKRTPGSNPDEKTETENNTQNTAAQLADSGNAGTTNDLQNPGDNLPENRPQDKGKQNKKNTGNATGKKEQPGNGNTDQIQAGESGNDTKGLADDPGNPVNAHKNAGTENTQDEDKELQTLQNRLRNSNLTPEKAKMLLEAMRQAEIQYLQQVPQKTTPKTKKSFPDW